MRLKELTDFVRTLCFQGRVQLEIRSADRRRVGFIYTKSSDLEKVVKKGSYCNIKIVC
jgi:hypothetical protein